MDHCEFPYGVEAPWAYTTLACLGWLLAALGLVVILLLLKERISPPKPGDTDAIAWKYATILAFAETAAKAELADIYKARDNLLRTITALLGDGPWIGAELGGEVAKLKAAGAAAKPPSAPSHQAAPGPVVPGPGAALTSNGPQVIVNLQNGGHGPHDGHGNAGQGAKPEPSVDDRLAEVRAAAGVFADYWRSRPRRLADLEAARDIINRRGDLPADLEKLRAAASDNQTAKTGRGRGATRR